MISSCRAVLGFAGLDVGQANLVVRWVLDIRPLVDTSCPKNKILHTSTLLKRLVWASQECNETRVKELEITETKRVYYRTYGVQIR